MQLRIEYKKQPLRIKKGSKIKISHQIIGDLQYLGREETISFTSPKIHHCTEHHSRNRAKQFGGHNESTGMLKPKYFQM